MKYAISLAAALAVGALSLGTTGAMAAKMSKSAMDTGSNAADTQGASGGGGGKMMKKGKGKKKM